MILNKLIITKKDRNMSLSVLTKYLLLKGKKYSIYKIEFPFHYLP